jgi:hypothetical protein
MVASFNTAAGGESLIAFMSSWSVIMAGSAKAPEMAATTEEPAANIVKMPFVLPSQISSEIASLKHLTAEFAETANALSLKALWAAAGDAHSASNTISPATMVSFTLPSMRASSKGVFLQREWSSIGSTT